MHRRHETRRGFVALLLGCALVASACAPGVYATCSNEGGDCTGADTFASSGVVVYPYGNVFTAPAELTSETGILVDYSDVDIQITYSVSSHTVPGGSFYKGHGYDTTPYLGTGDEYTHRGVYGTYSEQGVYEMRGKGISCSYRNGEPCYVDRNQPDSQKFEIVEGF